ncbi:MAG: hypoxanthine phosphoribosyltransferase [Oligoflexia bacterium]|nr:hypoxanthine phosphoribosyltransferase [Oligoflexia bacterium]
MTSINNIKVLISEEKIQARVKELGQEITKKYEGKELTLICVLKGSFLFYADLVRAIRLPVRCEFISVSSYGAEKTSSGEVKLALDISTPLDGRDLMIIEDIVDTGLTLKYIRELLSVRNPASIACCALLEKPEARKVEVPVEYRGFTIGNEFVVGYGLDYDQRYRELPFIGLCE